MISRSLRIVGLLRLVPTRDGVVRAPCRYPCLLQVEDDPAVDTPLTHAFEDGVDVLQPARMDMGVHLALRREVERFFQVLPRADDRAAHGDAFENDLEDWDWKVTGRQAVQTEHAFAPKHAQRLRERRRRNGGD